MAVLAAEVLMAPRVDPATAHQARVLKDIRAERGLTQAQVAEGFGLSLEGYRAYEKGYSRLRVGRVGDMASALGISSAELASRLDLSLPMDSASLRQELAALFGPDEGERVDQLVRDLATLPPSDRKQILDGIVDQVTGRKARLGRA